MAKERQRRTTVPECSSGAIGGNGKRWWMNGGGNGGNIRDPRTARKYLHIVVYVLLPFHILLILWLLGPLRAGPDIIL